MSIQGLKRLEVWVRAKDFAVTVYREVLPLLPKEEKWGLDQQLRRAVQSIPANIAEGYGRFYYQDNVRFCYIARGSLDETLSDLQLTYELKLIPLELYQRLVQDSDDLCRLINGYIAYLKKSKKGGNEPGSAQAIHEQQEDYNPDQDILDDDSTIDD
jgi:four helix bundle protein